MDCFTAKSVWFVWFHLNHALDAILFLVIRSAGDMSITVGHALTLNEVAKTYLGPIIHVSLPEDKCCNFCNKDALFPHLKFFHIYSFSEVMSEAFYMPITSNYIGLSYKKLNLIHCVTTSINRRTMDAKGHYLLSLKKFIKKKYSTYKVYKVYNWNVTNRTVVWVTFDNGKKFFFIIHDSVLFWRYLV